MVRATIVPAVSRRAAHTASSAGGSDAAASRRAAVEQLGSGRADLEQVQAQAAQPLQHPAQPGLVRRLGPKDGQRRFRAEVLRPDLLQEIRRNRAADAELVHLTHHLRAPLLLVAAPGDTGLATEPLGGPEDLPPRHPATRSSAPMAGASSRRVPDASSCPDEAFVRTGA